jgi:hypothetical protein
MGACKIFDSSGGFVINVVGLERRFGGLLTVDAVAEHFSDWISGDSIFHGAAETRPVNDRISSILGCYGFKVLG